MNVYDFDKTIFFPDSSTQFIKYCIKKKPYVIYKLPIALVALVKYKMGFAIKDKMKESI